MSLKLVCLSDTHNLHDQIKVPNGDVLIHCGDFTNYGRKEENSSFLKWFAAQPHKTKLLLIGNHDKERFFENSYKYSENLKSYRAQYPGITFLINDLVEVEGLKIYGCSWLQPLKPDVCDVFLSHEPPYGILDQVPIDSAFAPPDMNGKMSIGSKDILAYVESAKPKTSIMGHVHEGFGHLGKNGQDFYNAAICDGFKFNQGHLAVNGCTVVDI